MLGIEAPKRPLADCARGLGRHAIAFEILGEAGQEGVDVVGIVGGKLRLYGLGDGHVYLHK
ncbi:hypothetical protein D3C76_1475960 [compost metagenome]